MRSAQLASLVSDGDAEHAARATSATHLMLEV
jgi:hypothetical protein